MKKSTLLVLLFAVIIAAYFVTQKVQIEVGNGGETKTQTPPETKENHESTAQMGTVGENPASAGPMEGPLPCEVDPNSPACNQLQPPLPPEEMPVPPCELDPTLPPCAGEPVE